MASKPYLPLMMGDWLMGTRGMKSEVKGVYIGLLIHQYSEGFLPSDYEELCLIEPELPKVWDKLKVKFEEYEPGKLRNKKLEEVRDFWNKQGKNGSKGGRPKNENPNNNPDTNPNTNHHNDLDLDNDLDNVSDKEKRVQGEKPDEVKFEATWKQAFDSITLKGYKMKYRFLDITDELEDFLLKCQSDRGSYYLRDVGGLRLAFLHQLRNAKGNKPKTEKTLHELS